MKNSPLNAYKQTRVKTATQGKLIIMLYDGAIKEIDIALKEFAKESPQLDIISNSIIKTQEIITELMVSLDFEKGGEIAQNLFNLYTFFNQQLLTANLKKDPEVLPEIKNFLSELREAWATIDRQVGAQQSGPTLGVNIAG